MARSAIARVDPWLLATLVVAAATRLIQLSQPARLYFDEFYAQDACVYLGLPQAVCGQSVEVSWMHPPLGKWLISTGIAIFGFEPIAWRLASAAAGILLVALVYLLCRRLTGSRWAAALAAGLIALDPLAIEMSRIAMLDIFTATAGAATILFVVLDIQPGRARSPLGRRRLRPWRLAAGVAAGAAVATKWSGILILGVAIVLVLIYDSDRESRPDGDVPGRHRFAMSIASVAVYLLAVPAVVYVLSYAGRLGGDLAAVPWADGSWLHDFLSRQRDMAAFHLGLDTMHPSASPAWSWFLAMRPVVLLHEPAGGGQLREILALVNPLIWLPAFAATVTAAMTAIRRRRIRGVEVVVTLTVIGTYLPWLVLATDRSQVFAYYALPVLPFLALALAWAVSRLTRLKARALSAGLVVVSVCVFTFWFPLIYGRPMSAESSGTRLLFTDCAAPSDVSSGPSASAPPAGWCWR